jgi:hypothetical protein
LRGAVTPALSPTPSPTPVKRAVAPFEVIFQELRRAGTWILLPDGRWVWRPDGLPKDWRPFSRGTWVLTELGWYWLSQEYWGWATSHYGRWELQSGAGWVWAPDREWSPAWVQWRTSDAGLAWAPTPASTAGASTQPAAAAAARPESWTLLPWYNLGRAVKSEDTAKGSRGASVGLSITSATAASVAPALLSAMKDITKTERTSDVVVNQGPTPDEIASRARLRLERCAFMDTHNRREVLVFWRDGAAMVAFRPVIRESADEIQKFIAKKAEQYKTFEKKNTPRAAEPKSAAEPKGAAEPKRAAERK